MVKLPKIHVDILSPTTNHIIKHGKFKEDGNRIVIQKPKKLSGGKTAGYRPEFDQNCILTGERGIWPFKFTTRRLMLVNGASKCIEFNGKEIEPNLPNRSIIKELFDAGVLTKAGITLQKIQVPMLLYVAISIVIMLQIVSFLVNSGRVQFA